MHLFGVDLDFPYLHIAQWCPKQKSFSSYKSFYLSESPENVKQFYKGFRARWASTLPSSHLLIRPFSIKVPGNKHWEEAALFQAEALSHFKKEEALFFPLLFEKGKGEAKGHLLTVPREGLASHLQSLQSLSLDPDSVSALPFSLCQFLQWKFPDVKEAILIHLGSQETTQILIEGGKLKKSHSILKGVESLLSALHQDRKKTLLRKEIEGAAKQMDLLLLKPHLTPHLSEALLELRQEIAKVRYTFSENSSLPIFFTGRAESFLHLQSYLLEELSSLDLLTEEEKTYAVSMGASLEQIDRHPIQLRQEEFFPKKNWRKLGAYALCLMGISLLLSGALLYFSLYSSEQYKKNRQASFAHFSLEKGEGIATFEEKIDQWANFIEKNSQEFPYILQAPTVSETLSWLSSHPLLTVLKEEGDPIELERFSYELLSYPKVHNLKEPYLAKVEMEFRFQNGTHARKFHSALREGDALVDPSQEIHWDSLAQGYRVSFYLKNRRPHVP